MRRLRYAAAALATVAFIFGHTSSTQADELLGLPATGVLSDKQLAEERALGPADMLQINNDVDMNASMADNSMGSSTTGSNSIDNGSFSNLSGFGVVIQNTGNHVIIQNSTIVNYTMEQ